MIMNRTITIYEHPKPDSNLLDLTLVSQPILITALKYTPITGTAIDIILLKRLINPQSRRRENETYNRHSSKGDSYTNQESEIVELYPAL